MKYLFLLLIKSYWLIIPKSKRRKCIFKISCSHHVYDVTKEKGFLVGISALKFRYRNCRAGYEVFQNPITHKIEILLPSKLIAGNNEIAERFLIN